ncbi:MAG: hypothetical protein GW917_01525, partial [Bdellovibrionales bacterium]|nr:hypothetical protein [Bdellovibrionales bacterium]
LEFCKSSLRDAIEADSLFEFFEKYFKFGKEKYEDFFKIPRSVKNRSTSRQGPQLITRFKDPQSPSMQNFLKFNLEEEWTHSLLSINVIFGGAPSESKVNVEWLPDVTPHVKGLGSNEVVMNSDSSLDDWDTQWTIRHEFGHVLGFPDCYVEFYVPEEESIISYQLDVDNLMCSRKGVLNSGMIEELLRKY